MKVKMACLNFSCALNLLRFDSAFDSSGPSSVLPIDDITCSIHGNESASSAEGRFAGSFISSY